MKRTLALLLAIVMLLSLSLSGCGGESGDNGSGADVGSNEDVEFLDLTGNLPIIKDQAAFEEANGGKLTAFIINDAARTVEVKDLTMVQRWKEDTGIEFDWQVASPDSVEEKLSLMLSAGDDLPDIFWNFIGGQSGQYAVQ